jgi:hypothetical protein
MWGCRNLEKEEIKKKKKNERKGLILTGNSWKALKGWIHPTKDSRG